MARRTRETILLCEPAGFGNVLVETVGVGQSEAAVRSMTDFFLLLMLAGAGVELQGMKRGIIERIDAMAINKADGANRQTAERARVEFENALHLFPAPPDGWLPPVLTCSAVEGTGVPEIWETVLRHHAHMQAGGYLERRRSRQTLDWLEELIALGLEDAFRRHALVAARLGPLAQAVKRGETTPFAASRELLALFRER